MTSDRERSKWNRGTRRCAAAAAVLLIVWLGATLAAGGQEEERAALTRFLTAPQVEADWFAPSFLHAVPLAQLVPIRDQVTAGLGAFISVHKTTDRWEALYAQGRVPVLISLDALGRIEGLRLLPPVTRLKDLAAARTRLEALPGQVSVLVLADGVEKLALNADDALAVGSAFKLAILLALKQEIQQGRRSWADVVELKDADKSLPSGFLQDWPTGSPLSLHTVATLMISRSDNTATDLLLHTLGRQRIEQVLPASYPLPLLTTREAFALKLGAPDSLRTLYIEGDETARRAVLQEIAGLPLPDAARMGPGPTHQEIEWFLSARQLCDLLGQVADLDVFSVNPGVTDRNLWSSVAFKGGSEPGVLNLTTQVTDRAGHCISVGATWNRKDAAVEETRFAGIVAGILDTFRAGDAD